MSETIAEIYYKNTPPPPTNDKDSVKNLTNNGCDLIIPLPDTNSEVISPDYYKTNSVEVIDMMLKIWGKDAVITHCEMCAFKYRMRLGNKPNNSVEDDLGKAKWYEEKANELKNK